MSAELEMRATIADVASDTALDPAARVRKLRELREGISDPELIGQIEGYIASLELQREAVAIEQGVMRLALRENADIREVLISSGEATEEELDEAGYLSHEELDAREEDGSLVETIDLEEMRLRDILRWTKGFEKGGQFRPTRGGSAGRRVRKPTKTGREGGDRKAEKSAKRPAKSEAQTGSDRVNVDRSEQLADVRERSAGFTADAKPGPVGRRLLAGAKDTRDLYSRAIPASPGTSRKATQPARAYLPSRAKTHDEIAGQVLAGFNHETGRLDGGVSSLLGEDHPITKKLLDEGLSALTPEDREVIRAAAKEANGGDQPTSLFMMGGMAAGKSSALEADPSLKPQNAVEVTPDVYKTLLPEYQAMEQAGEGAGAVTVHNESNDIGKRIAAEAMSMGLNIVMDGTGKNPDFMDVLEDTSKDGYAIDVVAVTIPTDEAVIRNGLRAIETKRGAPEAIVRDSHRNVTLNFEQVSAAPFIRNVTLWDNGGEKDEPAVLIGRGSNGNFTVEDPELMDAFRAKADEPEFKGPEPAEDEAKKLAVPETDEFKQGVGQKAAELQKTSAAAPKSPGTESREKINDEWYKVLPDGSIDVKGDVELAADLLAEGRKVKLNQPDEVSTLLGKLAERVNEAKEKGEDAPNFNLCDVSVPGTNLFCVKSKGIPRVQMPQLAGFPIPGSKADKLADEGLIERSEQYIDPETGKGGLDLTSLFVASLRERGIKIERDEVPASHLRASQDELNGANVAKIAKEIESGRVPDGATLVSQDNYIVDGHHRWAAQVGVDAADGVIGDDMMMVDRVDIDIITLLAEAYAYAEEMGLPVMSVEAAGKGEKK